MNWKEQQTQVEKIKEKELLDSINLPKHIAIIMDGNGRWAVDKEMPRVSGHREGVESVREIVRNCSNLGVKYLTLYAFSIENWKRPASEVNALMTLLEVFLKKELDELHNNNVIIKTIGKTAALPKKVQKLLLKSIEKTKANTGMTLVLALSYSGRWDIVRAMQMISLDIRRGKLSPEDITDELMSQKLQTAGMPDPDLLIRTSGEMRISNFLLWELAYSEIYVSEKLWPEFRINELYEALRSYTNRERRFGKTSIQIAKEKELQESIKTNVEDNILIEIDSKEKEYTQYEFEAIAENEDNYSQNPIKNHNYTSKEKFEINNRKVGNYLQKIISIFK